MNVLVVGLGSIGRKHVGVLRELRPDVNIYALRSRKNAAKEISVINCFNIVDVSAVSFDFAIISNPTSYHRNALELLIPLDIPLFIEKPLSSTLELHDILEDIQKNNIMTYMACNLRFLDCLEYVKTMSEKKMLPRVNEVNIYCGSYLPGWRPSQNFRETYSARSEMGGGVHLDLIHELDYLYWIFGTPKEVRKILKSKSSLAISAIDYANYTLDYGDFCANVILNYYRRDPKRVFEIVFEEETWTVDLLQNNIQSESKKLFTSPQGMLETYSRQMAYFLEHLESRETTMNSIHDGFTVMDICL